MDKVTDGAGHRIGGLGDREKEVGYEAGVGCVRRLQGWTPGPWGRQASLMPPTRVCHSDQRLAQLEASLLWSQCHPEVQWRAVGARQGWLPSDGRPAALAAGRCAGLPTLVCSEK